MFKFKICFMFVWGKASHAFGGGTVVLKSCPKSRVSRQCDDLVMFRLGPGESTPRAQKLVL